MLEFSINYAGARSTAVERDEIPYPYKVHDTTLRPLLNITIKSTIVVSSRSRSCGGGDICGTTPA